jgi:hypothetical protein
MAGNDTGSIVRQESGGTETMPPRVVTKGELAVTGAFRILVHPDD